MPSHPRATALVDASSLRYFHTGLGQFCYHLLKEISEIDQSDFSFSALTHPNSIHHISDLSMHIEKANWMRRHLPTLFQPIVFERYSLWHITTENTRFISINSKSKVLLTIHGLHFLDEEPNDVAMAMLKEVQNLVDRADAISVVSDFTAALVRKHLHVADKPIVRIYNGISFNDSVISTPSSVPNQKFLFSVGTFFERKNFKVLIPLMQLLPEFTLVIAGNTGKSYAKAVRDEIVKMGLSDRVILPGEITEGEKNWYYKHCEAFLFPSISEGFGIPIIEAFHYGKPVFLSTLGSLPEIGKDMAFYWNNFNPAQMATVFREGMKQFACQPTRISQQIEYAQTFTWRKAAEHYLSLYNQLIA